jgi:hypothetical protein
MWGDFYPGHSPNWTFTNLINSNWTDSTGFAPTSKAIPYAYQALWNETIDGAFGATMVGTEQYQYNAIPLTAWIGWTTWYRMSTYGNN